jgi:hypothetical protein
MYNTVLSYLIGLGRAVFVIMCVISMGSKWKNISGIFVPEDRSKKDSVSISITLSSVSIIVLLYKTVFPYFLKFIACVFNEIII